MITFQRGLFNTNKSLCDIQEMYFRTNARNLDYENSIILNSGHFFSTDTYFNSISVGKIKKYTVIENVYLKLKVKGDFFLKIYHINNSLEKLEIFSKRYSLNKLAEINIELEQWANLSNGLIYFVIHAVDITSLYDFSYLTNTQPTQEVKLAIVITHFNRQQYLLPALKRIENELLNFSEFSNISVIVSDNSQNLNFESSEKIKIYKNKNYGGSGGFTFGLLKAQECNFTHCLFMDDDASTEIEAIKRIFNLLGFSKNGKLSIIGSMLYDNKKNIQHENGAILNKVVDSINRNLDLTSVKNLVLNEFYNKIDYAGWWFFSFPIKSLEHYPFPFFVRGDDVSFSIVNDFDFMTINGVCSWQEDFRYKHSAFLHYLNIRSLYVLNLTKQAKGGLLSFYEILFKSFLTGLLTYRYNIAIAALCAIKDVLKGEEFWVENLDMIKKREEINEKFIKYNSRHDVSINIEENFEKERFIKKIFRIVSFNGIFFPKFFLKNESKDLYFYNVSPKDVYLYRSIRYFNSKGDYELVILDRILIFKLLIEFFSIFLILIFSSVFMYSKYKTIYDNLTKKDFWLGVFDGK
ncbi:glycosyltransferase [Acinetobacter towneri]|uniref:glycosyltransferase n=1 Tax=Acinetobacter towneri TaxID=202956 RepID=UPI001436AD1D|nr:glycosyltransferase [Acinetobacter towneri]MCA4814602.1 hypothetical protein [Acinetobacter towneri]QIV93372.1 hypothetical protein GVU25_11585 [Acinetobacter towneri]